MPSESNRPAVNVSAAIALPDGGELVDVVGWEGSYLGVALAPVRFGGLAEGSAEMLLSTERRTWAVVETGDALRGVTPRSLLRLGDGLVLVGSTWSLDTGPTTRSSRRVLVWQA